MKPTQLARFALRIVPVLLVFASTACEQAVQAADGQAPVRKRVAKRARRLPPHYAAVVNEKQREEIYKIQEDYQPRIDVLQEQLKALKKERDEKISAVLTPEQRKKVAEAASKPKKNAGEAKPAKPATQPSSAAAEDPKAKTPKL
jgi:hypothetical protein